MHFLIHDTRILLSFSLFSVIRDTTFCEPVGHSWTSDASLHTEF